MYGYAVYCFCSEVVGGNVNDEQIVPTNERSSLVVQSSTEYIIISAFGSTGMLMRSIMRMFSFLSAARLARPPGELEAHGVEVSQA